MEIAPKILWKEFFECIFLISMPGVVPGRIRVHALHIVLRYNLFHFYGEKCMIQKGLTLFTSNLMMEFDSVSDQFCS